LLARVIHAGLRLATLDDAMHFSLLQCRTIDATPR
jgi:hypothetical protein